MRHDGKETLTPPRVIVHCNLVCANCGHGEDYHRDPWGKIMRCDFEEPHETIQCGCDNFQPKATESLPVQS